MKAQSIRTVATRSQTLVAICRKCGKKLGGGFGDGGKASLAKALKKDLDLPKWKRSPIRIVETGCMKLCPRGAVAVATSGDASLVYIIPEGTPVGEVAAHLGLRKALPAPE
jgi:predicted metal-binding protein